MGTFVLRLSARSGIADLAESSSNDPDGVLVVTFLRAWRGDAHCGRGRSPEIRRINIPAPIPGAQHLQPAPVRALQQRFGKAAGPPLCGPGLPASP